MKIQKFLEQFSAEFFLYFRLLSKTLGIISLTFFDVAVSGVSLYIIFSNAHDYLNNGFVSMAISLALTSISIYLWQDIRSSKLKFNPLIIIVIILQVIDLYIDVSIMEVVYGTGNIMLFGTPAAFAAVPRPVMWWAILIVIGILTVINEPLAAQMIESNGEYKSHNKNYNFPVRSEQRSNVQTVPVHQNSSPNMNNPVQNLSPIEQSVLSFVRKYKQEHGNKMPKYREIVKNTKLTSTSQVSPILERLNITS